MAHWDNTEEELRSTLEFQYEIFTTFYIYHFKITIVINFVKADHLDLIMGSLEYAIPSVGGFCVGTSYVVDHQRLSGLGNLLIAIQLRHTMI